MEAWIIMKMWDEIAEQATVLERLSESNKEIICKLVQAIHNENIYMVYLTGRGTSDHAAVYAKYLFEYMLSIPAAIAAPSINTIYGKSVNLKNALVIAISQSGSAEDALEVIREANRQNAITVAITNTLDSALAKETRFHLYCNAGPELSVAATKTFTAQMLLIAQLVAEWAEDYTMKHELISIPDKVASIIESADIIKEKAERYRFVDQYIILARGINYPIALEAALKLQEASYVNARAFSTASFYHGPFAMIRKDFPVMVFAPDGPSLFEMSNMISRLKDNQVDLTVVSNKKEILEAGNCGFHIPDTNNDVISAFFNVVVAQIFSYELAIIKNLNPDSPRGLKKVTITR
jgi:glucosamine--fructose-6-phosphate aminotransferase (isomerizing)